MCPRRSQAAHAEGLRADFTGHVDQAQVPGHFRWPGSCNRTISSRWKFKMTPTGQSWLFFPRLLQPQPSGSRLSCCAQPRAHSPERGRTRRRRCPGGPWPPWWGGWRRPAAAWGWAAPRPAGWPGNSGTGTDPSGTAPGSAPTRRSAPPRRERGEKKIWKNSQ